LRRGLRLRLTLPSATDCGRTATDVDGGRPALPPGTSERPAGSVRVRRIPARFSSLRHP
jgi:hypothetical protein